MINDCYSLHTFIMPFMWENEKADLNGIFSIDSDESIWITADPVPHRDNFSRTVFLSEMDNGEYNAYHFFNENARNLIFPDEENELLHKYKIKEKFKKDLRYIIVKGDDRYELIVDDIFLYIFSSDVAAIEIKCKNSSYKNISAVKDINEYGRRLVMPFWPEDGFSKCADSLAFKGAEIDLYEDFHSFKNNIVSFCYISHIIRELLNKNAKKITFRAKKTYSKNEIQIRTLIDEKMFVCCLINDAELAYGLLDSYDCNSGYFSKDTEEKLTELISVNTEGKCRGTNSHSIKRTLYNGLFVDDLGGTKPKLTSVTDQSFIKIISEGDYDTEYFDCIYTKAILIALIQKISIARFSVLINQWTNRLRSDHISFQKIRGVITFQQKIAMFSNQYITSEITVKKEGRFIYEHISSELNIRSEHDSLLNKVNSLYNLVNSVRGDTISKIGLVLSLVAIELAFSGQIINLKTIGSIGKITDFGITVLAVQSIIAVLIILFVSKILFNRRSK